VGLVVAGLVVLPVVAPMGEVDSRCNSLL